MANNENSNLVAIVAIIVIVAIIGIVLYFVMGNQPAGPVSTTVNAPAQTSAAAPSSGPSSVTTIRRTSVSAPAPSSTGASADISGTKVSVSKSTT